MNNPKKLFLLDAMALIYRAYFAFQRNPRVNSKGVNTSAVFGFANTLYDVLKKERPTHIAVAFDLYAPTLRDQEYSDYKAHREETPEDIVNSVPLIMAMLEAFNIPILAIEGYEADDIIGTIAKKAETEGFETYMMTTDKDFGQLVSENVKIYKPGRGGEKPEVLGVKEVCDKFGIEKPEQVIEILGLWGDASDNIPGIPGVGEVTAKKLIGEYGSIEKVIENASQLKGKLRESVEQYAEQALMSKRLATIILDVPADFEPEKLKITPPDIETLKALFDELEFKTLSQRIFSDLAGAGEQESFVETSDKSALNEIAEESLQALKGDRKNINNTHHQYYLVNTLEKTKELAAMLAAQKSFCFDTETTGIDPHTSELVGMSFSIRPHEAWYVPLPDNYNEALAIVSKFKPVFENPEIEKVGQNLKFDISMLRWYDVEVKGVIFDTMIAHYLIQPDLRHNMDFLAETYLNYTSVSIETLIGKKGKDQLSMRMVNLDELKEYACEDADITLQLRTAFEPLLEETGTRELFNTIETPLIPVLACMEAEGVKLDSNALKQYSDELQTEVKMIEGKIYALAGTTFNIASPKQLGEVLFEQLQISEKPKMTKTKQYATSEDVLQKLIEKHPIVPLILDYRSLTKLKSTYVDVLPQMINPRTGRIHTSFNQAVAATGRLSSNNPNLQNIPIRTEKGREIRKAFVPRNDKFTMLSADYSQVELRIIAELSGDTGMQEAFHLGQDIHASTAAKVYGVSLEDITPEMRRNAKMVNFGIIYGISAFGLSERLGIPRKEAGALISQYFEKYPRIKQYMDSTIEFARKNGYVETMMGRRRYIRDINSGNNVVRGFAERNAINAPIQGSAADMIKIAMINIHNAILEKGYKTRMLLQVHDELVFDVFKEELPEIKPLIESLMKNAIRLDTPVDVEINTGNNWLEAH